MKSARLARCRFNTNGGPRILIGICSCRRHSAKRAAIRETWLKDLPDGIEATFFVGKGGNLKEQDTIVLPTEDNYDHLPGKAHAFFQYALANCQFDYLFKCDDDTYVCTERLFDLIRQPEDFIGSADWWPSHADGGAGYMLSRNAVTIVSMAECPHAGAEDVWVTRTLREAGVNFHPSPRLRFDSREFPNTHNEAITAHQCPPDVLRVIHSYASAGRCRDVV